MSATKILNIVKKYISNPKDADLKKQFAYALNAYVDFRIAAIIKNYEHEFENKLLDILNSIPVPPENDKDIKNWIKEYKKWHNKIKKL